MAVGSARVLGSAVEAVEGYGSIGGISGMSGSSLPLPQWGLVEVRMGCPSAPVGWVVM